MRKYDKDSWAKLIDKKARYTNTVVDKQFDVVKLLDQIEILESPNI